MALAFVLSGVFSDGISDNGDNGDVERITYPDGAVIEYGHAAHALTATLPSGGTADITVPDSVTVHCKTADVTASESAKVHSQEISLDAHPLRGLRQPGVPFLHETSGAKLHAFECGFMGRLLGHHQHAALREFVPKFGPSGIDALRRELEFHCAAPALRQIEIHQGCGHGRESIGRSPRGRNPS
ncbi:hypothetical protein [Variovorax paradoxus]|uniref:hypothetical protein n=1 Tax=Variovorax paradoxus TaxID=34073 RepID=UPI003D649C4B